MSLQITIFFFFQVQYSFQWLLCSRKSFGNFLENDEFDLRELRLIQNYVAQSAKSCEIRLQLVDYQMD